MSKLVSWFQRIRTEERRRDEIIVNNFLIEIINILQRLQQINCFLAPMIHASISREDMQELERIFREVKSETEKGYLKKSGSRRVRFRRDYIILVETERVLRAIVRSSDDLLHSV